MTTIKNTGTSGLNLKRSLVASVLFLFSASAIFAQFAAGNLVVLQAGDGVATLANTGNQIILKEYTPSGSAGLTVPVSTSVNPLVISGSATSEGVLSLSANNKYLVFGGYAQSLPNTNALAAASSSVISRAVGIVNSLGSYTRTASSNTMYSGNNIRGAASDGNDNYWGAGGNDGTDYMGNSSTAVNVQNAKTNSRAVNVFNNQLYFSSQSSAGTSTLLGVYSVGTGTPLVTGQTITNVINTGTGSQPVQFYFNPASTICYVADQRNAAGGGVQKWIYSASTWSLAYTLPTGTAAIGAFGVVADFSGTNPKVYATTTEGSLNRLVAISDVGVASTATTLATAPANAIFRGLAFSPAISTGIAEQAYTEIQFTIYPNPVSSSLSISTDNIAEACKAEIRDVTGKLVQSFTIDKAAEVNVDGLAKGIYILKIATADNKTAFKKFIKE
ncbi:MAG: T9SS type A sorting domain-containing protein [Bacteroidia bacterium]